MGQDTGMINQSASAGSRSLDSLNNLNILKAPVASRRRFVRTFAFGTATALTGPAWVGTLVALLAGENRAQAAGNGILTLSLTDFPALLGEYGSVRVSVSPLSGSYPVGSIYPIIVSRETGDTFHALTANCPHHGCAVLPFNGTSISCPCHGSEFGIDGALMRGPASTNLTSYNVSYDGVDTLRISVPGLGYSLTNYKLVTGATRRMQLQFPTISQVQYEVRSRSTASAPWGVVPFAIKVSDPATNTVLNGTGAMASVFVDATASAGFFTVGMRVSEV
jgi:Rieske Fe-S protein